MCRLGDVGAVRGGYVGPDAVSDRPGPAGLRALQARDIGADGQIDWSALSFSAPARDGRRYAVNNGDVLFPLRSVRARAFVARGVPPGVIAAGQWAIIAPRVDLARPEYLAWFLNHPATAAHLARLVQGGSLPFISLAAIREFEIPVPPLEVQDRIIRVDHLERKLSALEQQLARVRTELVNAVTMSALHSA